MSRRDWEIAACGFLFGLIASTIIVLLVTLVVALI